MTWHHINEKTDWENNDTYGQIYYTAHGRHLKLEPTDRVHVRFPDGSTDHLPLEVLGSTVESRDMQATCTVYQERLGVRIFARGLNWMVLLQDLEIEL